MKFQLKTILLAGTIALSGTTYAQGTASQEVASQEIASSEQEVSAEENDSGEIIVTARRQNETLRDIPASVTVLTAATLEGTGAKVTADFVQLASGVTITTGSAEPTDTSVNIRGLNGVRDGEGNVALVIDGVLKTLTSAINQPQGAITQVEILKGPQGAIYGRNASAGAIVLTTKQPTDAFELDGKLSAANDSTYRATMLLSGPLSDAAGFVLNAEYSRSNGFLRNSFLPTQLSEDVYPGYSRKAASLDAYRAINLFGRVMLKPGERTEIDLKANYGHTRAGGVNYNAAFYLPVLAAAFNDPIFDQKSDNYDFVFTNNTESKSWNEVYGGSARITQDFDFATLIGSAAYNKVQADVIGGGTSGAFGFFNNEPNCIRTRAATDGRVVNQEPFHTYSAAFGNALPYSPTTCDGIQGNRKSQQDIVTELRLVGPTGGDLQWQVGASYIYIDRRVCVNLTLDTGIGGTRKCYTTDPRFPTEALQDDDYRSNIYAIFGAAEYKVTPRLKAGLALRYDIEARNTSNNVPTGRRTRWVGNPRTGNPIGTAGTPANYYLNPGLDPAYNPSGVLAPRSATFTQIEPKATLSFKASDDATLFASWGIGFKAGGFNGGGSATIVDNYFAAPASSGGINAQLSVPDTYRKETSSAFEAGAKGNLFGRLNYEIAGYYTDVTDMQFFEFLVGDFGLLRIVSNIDKVEIYGAEASLNFRIMHGWTMFSSGNIIESKIKANLSRPNTVGNKSPSTPDYTLNLGTQLLTPLSTTLDFMFRADLRVTGPTHFHTVQDNTVPTIFSLDGNFKNAERESYATANLRIGIQSDRWSLTAFANNLFNKQYLEELVVAPEFGGAFISPGQQRRYGIEAGFKF
jgi:iron complex outermembrane recepter protein